FAVGFRIHGGVPAYLLAVALVLLFAFALSWVVATVGLGAPNSEAAQAAIFPLMFPLTFASSAFVDTSFMPGWLQVFANHQPVTVTVDAARDLVLGHPVGWGAAASLAWSLGIVAVFAPLAVRRYRRALCPGGPVGRRVGTVARRPRCPPSALSPGTGPGERAP